MPITLSPVRSDRRLTARQIVAALGATALVGTGALATTMTGAQAAPPTAQTPACPDPNAMPNLGTLATKNSLWTDNTATVLVQGSYRTTNSESEGPLVVLGDLLSEGSVFNVGSAGGGSLIVPEFGTTYLAVGGDVIVTSGRIAVGESMPGRAYAGGADIGGSVTGTVSADPLLTHRGPASVSPWTPLLTTALAESATYGALPTTGTYSRGPGAGDPLTITAGSSTELNVVTIPASVLNAMPSSYHPSIDLVGVGANTAPLVINVLDDTGGVFSLKTASYSADGIMLSPNSLDGSNPFGNVTARVLWNLAPSFADVAIGETGLPGAQMIGSWLIPGATSTTLLHASTNGRVWTAGDLETLGSGNEQHAYPWLSAPSVLTCTTGPTGTPTPSPTVTPTPTGTPTPTQSSTPTSTPVPTTSPVPSLEPSEGPSTGDPTTTPATDGDDATPGPGDGAPTDRPQEAPSDSPSDDGDSSTVDEPSTPASTEGIADPEERLPVTGAQTVVGAVLALALAVGGIVVMALRRRNA